MGGGPPQFPQGFPCPVVLGMKAQGDHSPFAYGAITLCGPPFQVGSARGRFCNSPRGPRTPPAFSHDPGGTTRAGLAYLRFGLFPFRSPLLGESLLLSFPGGTEMFQFPPLAPPRLCIQRGVTRHYPRRVAPFGNPRIKGCLRLPGAYRSLPRPSSPPRAEASSMCP